MGAIKIPKKYYWGLLGVFDPKVAVKDGELWRIKKRDPLCDDFHHDWSCYRGKVVCPFVQCRGIGKVATACFSFLADATGKIPSDWPVIIETSGVRWQDERDEEARNFLSFVQKKLEDSVIWT